MVVHGVQHVDVEMVKSYAQDLRSLLEEADFTESKTFLRSFVKRIVVNKKQVTIYYNLPIPPEGKKKQSVGVLPIDTLGGQYWTIDRTRLNPSRVTTAIRHSLAGKPQSQTSDITVTVKQWSFSLSLFTECWVL